MQAQTTRAPAPSATLVPSRQGVVTLSGYGVRIAVERGRLRLSDGIGGERRAGTFARATAGIKRLVLLGHSGTVSLEALRWLYDVGADVIQVDKDGEVTLTSGSLGSDFAHLRRAQAAAPWTGAGAAITRELLRRKLEGQASVIREVAPEAALTIERHAEALAYPDSRDDFRVVESQAAACYWHALAAIPVRFARRDEPKVADHWKVLGTRVSPVTGSPRTAATPANAMLNYLYAMLEAETRIACLAVGLDPGLGVLHADLRSRDSLACDLMEAVRPDVDRWLLRFIRERVFKADDFFETKTGQCRVLPPLTHTLAETLPEWQRAIAPVAEWTAQTLLEMGPGAPVLAKPPRLPTPLTQANRSRGRALPRKERACLQCGGVLPSMEVKLCSEACRSVYFEEHSLPKFEQAGPAKLAQLRAEGKDPSKTPEARAKLVATKRLRDEARREWELKHEGEAWDPETFRSDILPGLQAVSASAIMRATGLNLQYCSKIKRGERVPHPLHWQRLSETALTIHGAIV